MLPSQHRLLIAAALLLAGCSSKALTGDGNNDAAPDVRIDAPTGVDTPPDGIPDAAACGCRVESNTLVMSWDCFCNAYGCTLPAPVCSGSHQFTTSCGLVTETLLTVGGPFIAVWDTTGTLVGRQAASDTSYYKCPSDPSLEAGIVRAGQFPDPTCESVVACDCVDGGITQCPVLPALDAGTDGLPPIDGGPIVLDAAAGDGGGGGDAGDVGVSPDGGCAGQPMACTTGSVGGQCSDFFSAQTTCSNGVWSCPGGTVLASQCGCIGAPPPGCSCSSHGFACSAPDGAAGG